MSKESLKQNSPMTLPLWYKHCYHSAAATAKSLQPCLTLCDPIDASPPGSPIPGILQARTLESVAISFSNAWKWKVKVKSLSRVWLLATPWTAAYQAPLSKGFSRQEYWSGLPLPSHSNTTHITYSFFADCTYSCTQSFAFIETSFFFFSACWLLCCASHLFLFC